MKKALLVTLALATSVLATSGYEVYKKNCMSCHVEMMSKKEVMANIKDLKAPPMVEVSGRLKENIKTTDDEDDVNRYLFILFVKDYIINPNLDNSMCHPGALERFGTMPSLKGKVSANEAQAVAEWLYDRYENIKF